MPADDDSHSSSLRLDVKFSDIVKRVHYNVVNLEGVTLGQTASPRLSINVAAYSLDRGDGLQAMEHFRLADVAGVNNQLGAS